MRYDIYNHKAPRDGVSPLSPESPVAEASASPRTAAKNSVLLTYGGMMAQRALNTFVEDIRAGGNEELATTTNNIVTGTTVGMSIVATKGLALIPLAIQGSASAFTQHRGRARENRNNAFELEQMGQRLTHNQRGVSYFE